MLVVERAGVGIFGRRLAQHGIGLGRETLLPLGIGELERGGRGGHRVGLMPARQPPHEGADGGGGAQTEEGAAMRGGERLGHTPSVRPDLTSGYTLRAPPKAYLTHMSA